MFSTSRSASGLLLLLVLGACGPAHRQQTRSAPGDPISRDVRAALVLPPAKNVEGALARLAKRRSSCEAHWLRVRYLMDLFDWVRLLPGDGEDHALQALWRGCGLRGQAARGRIATGQVVEALRGLLERTTRRCQGAEARGARDGLELLRADRTPRATHDQALRVAVTYRRLAGSGSPFAPNAALRLTDWCAQAFRLAAGGDPKDQHLRLDQCLYPLFPADPAPYFREDPGQRPPDPPWTVLREQLFRARIPLLMSRLSPLARRLEAADKRFFAAAAGTLPSPLRLSTVDLPLLRGGRPWDRTPLVVFATRGYIVGGRPVLEQDEDNLERAIAARLHNDGRRHITVVAERKDFASRLLDLGRVARRAGASTMGLAGAREVARPTEGDVQKLVFGDKPVLRLQEIPVSLELLSSASAAAPSRTLPRGLTYDPRTAAGQLALLIVRDGVRLMSRDGRTGPIRAEDLPARLRQARRVYPDDRSIVLAPDRATMYADLLAVATAVRQHDGQPLFPGLALAQPLSLSQPGDDLAPVLRLLGAARVEMTPALNRSWPALARKCYLETLRKYVGKPGRPPSGTLKVTPGKAKLRISGGSLRHAGLRACVRKNLGTVPLKTPGPVTLTFTR